MERPTFPPNEACSSPANIPGRGGVVLDHSDPLRSHPVPRVFKMETPPPEDPPKATTSDMEPDPEMKSELEMDATPAAAEPEMLAIASTMANAPLATAPKMATALIDARPSISDTSEPVQLEDPYGVLSAINVFDIIVPMSPWDLSLERVWPPAPYQLYCVNHFLHECIIYYSLTSTELKRREELVRQLMAETNQESTESPSSSSPTSVRPQKESASSAMLQSILVMKHTVESLKKQKRLDLPWPVFCALLKDQIVEAATRRSAPWKKRQAAHGVMRDSSASAQACEEAVAFFRLSNSPIDWPCPPECRYCQQRQVDLANLSAEDASHQQRRAPMAPMHHMDDSNIDKDQLAEFGGIKFAVDIYDDEVKIILLEMPTLEAE
ncbi:hypothetical protein LQW54_009928 [Pestalotiopsis sp. IQ-011]